MFRWLAQLFATSQPETADDSEGLVAFVLPKDAGAKFAFSALRQCTPQEIRRIADPTEQEEGERFWYLGHADVLGPFSKVNRQGDPEAYYCSPADVGNMRTSPLIWWACFSATWGGSGGRSDWIGFDGRIGYPVRGNQTRWWTEYFKELFPVLEASARGQVGIDQV